MLRQKYGVRHPDRDYFQESACESEGEEREGKNETLGRLLRLHATAQRGLPALNTDISHRRELPADFLKAERDVRATAEMFALPV